MKPLLFTLFSLIMTFPIQAQVDTEIVARLTKLENQVQELQKKVAQLQTAPISDSTHTPKTATAIQEITQDGLSIKVIEVKKADEVDLALYEPGEQIVIETMIKNISDQDIPFIFDPLVNVVDAEGNAIKCYWNLWDNFAQKFVPGIPVKKTLF